MMVYVVTEHHPYESTGDEILGVRLTEDEAKDLVRQAGGYKLFNSHEWFDIAVFETDAPLKEG